MKLPKIDFDLSRRLFSTRRRTIVIALGLVLATLSIYYTWTVSTAMKHEDEAALIQLRHDERNAVEMWEDILHTTNIGGQMIHNPALLNKLAEHTNVPLIIADERLNVWVTNLPSEIVDDPQRLREEIMRMSETNKPISVEWGIVQQTTFTIYFGSTDYSSVVSSAHSEALAMFA